MILITLRRALLEKFDRHRIIARWTLPLWFYVCVTGVIVYLMVYQIYPQPSLMCTKSCRLPKQPLSPISAPAVTVSLTRSRIFSSIPSQAYCSASSEPFALSFALSVASVNSLSTASANRAVPSAINTCSPSTQGNPVAPREVVTVGTPMLNNSKSFSRMPVPLTTGTTPTSHPP